MILFYGEGRLGNQLFQYHALAAIARPGECILAIGLEDLAECVELSGPPVRSLRLGLWGKRAVKYVVLPLLARPLSRFARLAGYAREAREGEPPVVQRGLLSRLVFVDGGYYQRPGAWVARFPARLTRPRAHWRRMAQEFLEARCPEGLLPVFVHVRRGDYLRHAFDERGSLALPVSYYREAIAQLRRRVAQPLLLFVTDDPAWIDGEFGDIEPRAVASSGQAADWALMACCRAGVLSNSTFSLSASLHMDDPQWLIGPLHWLGFRQGGWNPPGIELDDRRLEYIPVPAATEGAAP